MTIMTARYPGTCSATGRKIKPGDRIDYSYRTKTTRLVDDQSALQVENDLGDDGPNLAARTRSSGYVSHVFNIGGREYYRNKRGQCEDAPACGCCTI